MDLTQAEFANEAFYLAFEAKDIDAMRHLWSETREIICLHPGWPPLIGRQAVLDSWATILGNPAQAQVSFFEPVCRQLSADTVAVVCYESAPGATLVATNLFAFEPDGLRMVLHQAGVCANPPGR